MESIPVNSFIEVDSREAAKEREELDKKEAATLLCHNCGWNAALQLHSGYVSTVKCFFGCGDRGVWQLGNGYILKERPLINHWGEDNSAGPDVATINWLRENTTIPVPAKAQEWEDGCSHFSLMKKMPGESLEMAWPRLNAEEKKTCAREVVEYLAQLRTHTAPTPQTVDGAPARDKMFAYDGEVAMLEDKEAWWARVEKGFAKKEPAWREELKAEYPGYAAPYVLTHGDLNTGNIMVHDGHVSGIIDWEYAGYYPDWWESTTAMTVIEEQEWRYYLVIEMDKQIGKHTDALKFLRKFQSGYRVPPIARTKQRGMPAESRGNFCDCKPYARC
jgi:hypothetical protein